MKKVILAAILALLFINPVGWADILPALTITDTGYGGGALIVREVGNLQ